MLDPKTKNADYFYGEVYGTLKKQDEKFGIRFECKYDELLGAGIQRVKRNSELTELTPYALRELVKAVYVEAPDKSSGKRKQKIHISYDLIGFIPVDVLTKAEQA